MKTPIKTVVVLSTLVLVSCQNTLSVEIKNRYVEIEAGRLCAIQKQTHSTQEELEKSFESTLNSAGFTDSEKKALTELRDKDEKFRQQISDRYQQICKS